MASVSRELVLNYLKQHFGQEFTKQDLVEALGLSMASVNGVINGLFVVSASLSALKL